ncbi:MAG: rhomboid family intramembrane serine protease, partial [Bdellovibrionota bacterium]
CGIGAAFIYVGSVVVYYLVTGKPMVVPMNVMMNSSNPMWEPVVGASGAVFGLILAYGMLFGERTVLFFMLFPMKARYFVMILAGIEFFSLIGQGFSSQVSNLAHLGGFIVGYLILRVTPRLKEYLVRRQTENRGRRLKLVVDNESQKNPKYWN